MAFIIPELFYLPAGETKTYYEDMSTGKNATINILNLSPHPVELIVSSAEAEDATYTISGFNSRSLSVELLTKVELSSSAEGAAFGGLLISSFEDAIPTI
ncbi:hypothetical protein ACK8P5_13055 [Paenibacillus sp. EC2-1]|uniref:hypothetical protein n=1 Tax=Paenibacillus sp. EC2-1 TaxID=3388665 RepID=UPI003BEEFF85